jgi:hypothetical protein
MQLEDGTYSVKREKHGAATFQIIDDTGVYVALCTHCGFTPYRIQRGSFDDWAYSEFVDMMTKHQCQPLTVGTTTSHPSGQKEATFLVSIWPDRNKTVVNIESRLPFSEQFVEDLAALIQKHQVTVGPKSE